MEREDLDQEEAEIELNCEELEDGRCLVVAICNDHDRIKGLYRRWRSPGLGTQERRALLADILKALQAHVAAEEAVVLPALDAALGGGAAGRALRLDETLKMLLADLGEGLGRQRDEEEEEEEEQEADGGEGRQADAPAAASAVAATVERLMGVFFEHVASGEHSLPALREAVGEDGLFALGCAFNDAKARASAADADARPAVARA